MQQLNWLRANVQNMINK